MAINSDTNDYIYGVFVTRVIDNTVAQQLIGRISKIVYEDLVKSEVR